MEMKFLPLSERIKQLRKMKGWTQGDLAEKIGTDARMISQYEKGKSIPSIDYVVKFAEIFDVSIDYLLLIDAPKRPFKQHGDRELIENLEEIEKLNDKDKEIVLYMIKSLITKNKVKDLVTSAS